MKLTCRYIFYVELYSGVVLFSVILGLGLGLGLGLRSVIGLGFKVRVRVRFRD